MLIESVCACEHEGIRGDAAHVGARLRIVGIDGVEECFECGGGNALAESLIVSAPERQGGPGAQCAEGEETGAGHWRAGVGVGVRE